MRKSRTYGFVRAIQSNLYFYSIINNKVKTRIKRKIKYLSIYDKDKLVRVKASYYGYMKRASTNYLQYKFKIKS